MDVLLTHGYFLYEDPHELKVMKPYPPLGILYISAYLKRVGYHVGVLDTTFGSMADFEATIERERPPVVGLYTNLMTKFNVLKLIAVCKRLGATVILGGPEPACYVEEYLDRGADVIVAGEGEAALEELLPRLAASRDGPHRLDGIPGIAYRRDDGVIVRALPRTYIADLDSLPDPDREAIDIERYVETWRAHHGMGSVSLICARGCPYHCEWCSHAVYGHTHRRRSPGRVADEVEDLLSRYKPDQLWYADDVFTIKHGWFFEYAAELKRRGIRTPFECISRADRLNEQVIDTLAEMGCYRLWIGSESGSQKVLDEMRREVKVEQVQAMIHALKRRGIQTGMFIMLGYEGEEIEDLEVTVDHLKKSTPDVFLTTVAYPIKGTAYYEKVEDRVLARADWDRRTDRQLTVKGRHSMRFYSFATRWMVNSVALHRERKNGASMTRLAKAAANVALGRAGMMLTAGERET
ncbi:MAG TPA: radical SAM protein [Anaerolineae bacterium]|nr:radical SAM protein [Anaerolineae bacterium]